MEIIELYKEGNSIPEVSALVGKSRSTVRYHLKKSGVLRTRKEAINIAAKKGRLSSNKGSKKNFTDEWKKNISKGRLEWSKKNAKGVSLKPSGYLEVTVGENKFRLLHVVIMEKIIGRRLYSNECVHHKDGNKLNNDVCNLELMTKSEHSRLHGKENYKKRKIDKKGRFV